jgi:hypothetical protein
MRAARAAVVVAVACLGLSLPAGALGQEAEAHTLSKSDISDIARHDPNVQREEAAHGNLVPSPTLKNGHWEVGFFKGDQELALVFVDPASGRITESWTGYQVAWSMARGYPGAFGRKVNAPYVWLPLCAFFLLGLLDYRRLGRIAHLDLLAILGFGASQFFFNEGNIGISVPLVYPVLLYIGARMAWIGFRGRGEPLRPSLSTTWLAVGIVFLLAFRIALNIADSNVIDVGYSGVTGADHVTHGQSIYGAGRFPDDNAFGDTYGPANYYAYVPFELALPWSGSWDDLPAAHAAAIAFDLLTIAGLFLVGRRMRTGPAGVRLGTVMAFAWAACPYTAYALESNSNDELVSALLVGVLLLVRSAPGRGAMTAIAGLTKFAPLPLAPLFATGVREGERSLPGGFARRLREVVGGRQTAMFAIGFLLIAALLLAGPAIDPGLGTFWDRTIASQADRSSPFSVWGQVSSLDWLRRAMEVGVAVLAIGVAFVPRTRTLRQVAALAALVTIGIELILKHWFYLYIPWFLPFFIIALTVAPTGREGAPAGERAASEPGTGLPREPVPA